MQRGAVVAIFRIDGSTARDQPGDFLDVALVGGGVKTGVRRNLARRRRGLRVGGQRHRAETCQNQCRNRQEFSHSSHPVFSPVAATTGGSECEENVSVRCFQAGLARFSRNHALAKKKAAVGAGIPDLHDREASLCGVVEGEALDAGCR